MKHRLGIGAKGGLSDVSDTHRTVRVRVVAVACAVIDPTTFLTRRSGSFRVVASRKRRPHLDIVSDAEAGCDWVRRIGVR